MKEATLALALLTLTLLLSFPGVAAAVLPIAEIDFDAPMYAQLSENEKALLREYRENYVRLNEVLFGNITVGVHCERVILPFASEDPDTSSGERLSVTKGDYLFRSSGGKYFRMEGTKRVYSSADLKEKTARTGLGILTPEGFWLLERPSKDEPYRIVAKGAGEEAKWKAVAELFSYKFPMAPFSYDGLPLNYYLFQKQGNAKSAVVEKIELRKEKGENLAVVFLRLNFAGKAYSSLVFEFYKDRHWALKRAVGTLDDPKEPTGLVVTTSTCVYEGEKGGFPLLKKYTIEHSLKGRDDGETRPVSSSVFDVTKIVPGAVPLAEFEVKRLVEE